MMPQTSDGASAGTMRACRLPTPCDFPAELQAPGTATHPSRPRCALAELPPGAMTRVSRGDLDLLLAHTDAGHRGHR